MGKPMNFLKKIFQKKEVYQEETQWDEEVYERDSTDIHNKEERTKYLESCMEQMGDASKEIEFLTGEYNLVTTYLTDVDEIEQLPEEDKEELVEVCSRMVTVGGEKETYKVRTNRMKQSHYQNIERIELEVEEGIDKILEAEEYRKLIKQDLRRLDGERNAFHFRQYELESKLINLKGMAIILMVALGVCFALLMLLQFGLNLDTRLGYLLMAGTAAIAITVIYLKYTDAQKELERVHNGTQRLIQLHNTVKIRYVNNTSLLEYFYAKFKIESGAQLKAHWEMYQVEREERRKERRAEMELDIYQEELMKLLYRFRIKEPARWLKQTAAVVDSREMVELRHELIARRQALRKQIDYNKEVAEGAKAEVMDIVKKYPQYAEEITTMVDRYEKMY